MVLLQVKDAVDTGTDVLHKVHTATEDLSVIVLLSIMLIGSIFVNYLQAKRMIAREKELDKERKEYRDKVISGGK